MFLMQGKMFLEKRQIFIDIFSFRAYNLNISHNLTMHAITSKLLNMEEDSMNQNIRKVALLGMGTVGGGVYKLLKNKRMN